MLKLCAKEGRTRLYSLDRNGVGDLAAGVGWEREHPVNGQPHVS